jgi:cell wall-associated NlpC family hydrolase
MLTKRERFLVYLATLNNIPYIWGGEDPGYGLDCSGHAQLALDELNLDPPGDQTADALMKSLLARGGRKVSMAEATLGCLIFYGKPAPGKATHVTVYLGDGLAQGANGGGSDCITPAIARSRNAKVKVHSPSYRGDMLCVIKPAGLEL